VGSVPPERGGRQCLIQNASCCHKFVGRCRPSVHEYWICLKFTPTIFVHFCSALFGPENHLSSNTSFFSSVDSLANFNNKITKISRIYAHPKKEQNFQNFHQFLCREMARSHKRKKTPSRWFVLVWSSLSVGLHQALAQLQLFYSGAGYV
jgi:hypothetical protein